MGMVIEFLKRLVFPSRRVPMDDKPKQLTKGFIYVNTDVLREIGLSEEDIERFMGNEEFVCVEM